ncbi:arginine--tRNA ligase [Peptococcaceae bacterium SCADC1_2_3]|nr:arginine--tRNA ligase [Peptococcaceae bacterium SCADC1_2_3]HBQ29329.1 arginine--tRNA ligase [Desulfotomaculum sp.]HCJ78737.1 arginine--tRNA ligase [Desulfotomaculum sp.]
MNIIARLRAELNHALIKAVTLASQKMRFPAAGIPDFVLEVPREKEHGDFATNLALLLAGALKMSPRKIAGIIKEELNFEGLPVIKVEVAGPGFINFYLDPAWALRVIPEIINQGEDYGRVNIGNREKVQVEYVSANPTGLLHMGNARGAALGDSIASLLDFADYQVTREFYVNDAGTQIENLGKSLAARYFQLLGFKAEIPEEGYHGEDLVATTKKFIALYQDKYLKESASVREEALVKYALDEAITAIKKTLAEFGVHYDVWFSEASLYAGGSVKEIIERLKEKGFGYEHEGALWFKAREFGARQDEVLVRNNGAPTYFAADIAYHVNKLQRGFTKIINIWGADHHGHVARLKGALAALGYSPDAVQVIIMQLVRLYRGGEIVRMSKRTGQYVSLEDLIEEVGRDAARYFFVMRSADSHLDFDLDLAREQSVKNPVYYIQYAHARICSLKKVLAEQGRTMPRVSSTDLTLLTQEAELALARRLADFPEEVTRAVQNLAPHQIASYIHEVAGLLHAFYNHHRVITADPALSNSRVLLVEATRIVLANALKLLGIKSPERM